MDQVHFQDNYVFVSVTGYKINPEDVAYVSSPPLFSWTDNNYTKDIVSWGCEKFYYPNRSYWVTELTLIRGKYPQEHFVPGAYLGVRKNSFSFKHFIDSWINMHDKYIFKVEEISPQKVVQKLLCDCIDKNTVVFYKGEESEKTIAELCEAREYVNIENLGIVENPDFSAGPLTTPTCKIHSQRYDCCSEQKLFYYMSKSSEWLLTYENKKAENNKKFLSCINNNNVPPVSSENVYVKIEENVTGEEETRKLENNCEIKKQEIEKDILEMNDLMEFDFEL